MNIYNLTITSGADVFYTKGFMDTLESHLDYFRKSSKSNSIVVESKMTKIYRGDFFGYLNEIGIEQKYHWLVMRINDLFSNFQFNEDIVSIIIPDTREVEKIRSAYMASGNVNI